MKTTYWNPPYDFNDTIAMNITRSDGARIPTVMEGWYWNALDWLISSTGNKNLTFKLVEFSLATAVQCKVEWNEAIKAVILRYYKEYRKCQNNAAAEKRRANTIKSA